MIRAKATPGLNVVLFVTLAGLMPTRGANAQDAETKPVEEAATATVAVEEDVTVEQFLEMLEWEEEGTSSIGDRAELTIPEGYRLGGNKTTVALMSAMGNLTSGQELAIVGPRDLDWFVIYEFEDIGYVKDNEELDPDSMLVEQKEQAKRSNAYRKEQGLATVNILGWAIPPRYEEGSNVLEWAVRVEFIGDDGSKSETVNYRTKVLGRRGVMDVLVVCSPDKLDTVLPAYRDLMRGFAFVEGERYAEYKPGDKIAQYGLAALVLGGATAVAAKTGLFAAILLFMKKGWKMVMVGIVALGGAISRLFGGRRGPRDEA